MKMRGQRLGVELGRLKAPRPIPGGHHEIVGEIAWYTSFSSRARWISDKPGGVCVLRDTRAASHRATQDVLPYTTSDFSRTQR